MDEQSPIGVEQRGTQSETDARRETPGSPFISSIRMLILVALAIGGYFGLQFLNINTGSQFTEIPEGQLVLSLTALPLDGAAGRIIPLEYDARLDDFLIPPVDDLSTDIEGYKIAYQHRSSNKGEWMVFVGAVGLEGAQFDISSIPFEVYRADMRGVTYDNFIPVLQNAERITDEAATHKQFPSVSDAGDVVYMARAVSGGASAENANSWGIYLVSREGNGPLFLTSGIHPHWIDTSRFVYIEDDGLHIFDIGEGSSKRVWSVRGAATTDMTLDVSKDGQFIAWASPNTGEIFILRKTNTLSGADALELHGIIPLSGWYPVISPDSRFLAVQAHTAFRDGGASLLSIEYFDLGNLQALPAATVILDGVYMNALDRIQERAVSGSSKASGPSAVIIDRSGPNHAILTDWMP